MQIYTNDSFNHFYIVWKQLVKWTEMWQSCLMCSMSLYLPHQTSLNWQGIKIVKAVFCHGLLLKDAVKSNVISKPV